jgi:hypothetical protein
VTRHGSFFHGFAQVPDSFIPKPVQELTGTDPLGQVQDPPAQTAATATSPQHRDAPDTHGGPLVAGHTSVSKATIKVGDLSSQTPSGMTRSNCAETKDSVPTSAVCPVTIVAFDCPFTTCTAWCSREHVKRVSKHETPASVR